MDKEQMRLVASNTRWVWAFYNDVFGLETRYNKYSACSECGREYWGERPLYCKCGKAGGCCKTSPLPMIHLTVKRLHPEIDVPARVDYWREQIFERGVRAVSKTDFTPHDGALFISAAYHLMKG